MSVPSEFYLQESSFRDPLPIKQCNCCGMVKVLSPENYYLVNGRIFRLKCKVCFNTYGRRRYHQQRRAYVYVTPQILNSNTTP